MKNHSNLSAHYCCIYIAKGICNPPPDLDSLLLKDENVAVRIIGSKAYTDLVEYILSPLGNDSADNLDDRAREKLQIRRNTLICTAQSHAVIHVASSLPLDVVNDYHEDNSETSAYAKAPLKSNAESAFKSVSSAITFTRENTFSKNYDLIYEQYYITNSESKIITRPTIPFISEEGPISEISMEELRFAKKFASILHHEKEISKIIEVYSDSLTPYKSSHLHAFIAAWTALEIFVTKQFKDLQPTISININGIPAHKDFSTQMLSIMSDKYRLTGKFAVISNIFDSNNSDKDIDQFKKIKLIRDEFFHSMKGEAKDLPLDLTRQLFSKYFKIYLINKYSIN